MIQKHFCMWWSVCVGVGGGRGQRSAPRDEWSWHRLWDSWVVSSLGTAPRWALPLLGRLGGWGLTDQVWTSQGCLRDEEPWSVSSWAGARSNQSLRKAFTLLSMWGGGAGCGPGPLQGPLIDSDKNLVPYFMAEEAAGESHRLCSIEGTWEAVGDERRNLCRQCSLLFSP